MKPPAFLRSSEVTTRVSRHVWHTYNDISRIWLRSVSQFCVLHDRTIHSTLLHAQNSTWIQLRNKKKQFGFDMSTEWKQRDWLKYCKNYKKCACYRPDQLILLHFITITKLGYNLEGVGEFDSPYLQNGNKETGQNTTRITTDFHSTCQTNQFYFISSP